MTRQLALLMAGSALLSACTPATTSTETMASTDTTATPAPSGNPLTADWTGPYGGVPAWDKLDVGGLCINDVSSFRVDNMPYGGVKDSGLGREGIRFAMEDMSEIRNLLIRKV